MLSAARAATASFLLGTGTLPLAIDIRTAKDLECMAINHQTLDSRPADSWTIGLDHQAESTW